MIEIQLSLQEAYQLNALLATAIQVNPNCLIGSNKYAYINIKNLLELAIDKEEVQLDDLMKGHLNTFKPGRYWQDYEGIIYQVVTPPDVLEVATEEEVWYKCLKTKQIFRKSIEEFCSSKEVDGELVPLFKPVIG